MRLTFILLTATFLNVSAIGVSQKLTFSGKNVELQKIFSIIEMQTGYMVFGNADLLKKAKPVSLEAKDMPLIDALNIILKDQPFGYKISEKAILLSSKAVSLENLESSAAILAPPGNVKGRVVNENGEALAGATIKISGTNLMATTDDKGYYTIQNIAPGEYALIVTYVGYTTKNATIKITESGTAAFNCTLAPSLVNLDEMTVTSTLSKRLIRAYPATIAEIKGKDLENRNLNNIANVLDAIPGVIVGLGAELDNSGSERQPSGILIRGTSAGAPIKYLVDGVDIVSASSQTVSGGALSVLQTLDPNDIEKIEVLKGPMASTLYGSGAAGGIISITTKKGRAGKPKINFKTMFTQYANDYADYNGYSQNYSLNVSGGGEQFNYLLGTAYNLYPTTKLTDINNGIDDKTWSYTAKIRGKVKNIAADISLQYGNEKSGSGDITPSTNKFRASLGLSQFPINTFQDIRNSQRNFLTTLHLTHTFAENWYQDLTVGYNISNYMYAYYTPTDYDGTYASSENLYSKINARYFMFYDQSWSTAIKTSITAGFEYNGYETKRMYIYTTSPLTNFFTASTPGTVGDASFSKSPYSSTGYFAEAVTGLRNKLFLTTGIRYDVNPAYGDNVGAYAQPRVGLSYVIEPGKFKIKPRIVWGVSSTPPEPTSKSTTIIQSSYSTNIYLGNSNIKPQRSEGYEFGADIFYGNNYSLNVTYYDQKIKDMIQQSYDYDYSTNPMTITIYNYNVANAINRGLEVSAKAVFDPFTVDISYTEIVSKWGNEIGQTPNATVYAGAPNLSIPKKSIFTRLSYSIPSFLSWTKKGGRISLDWKYDGSSLNADAISFFLDRKAWLALPAPRPAPPNVLNYYKWLKGYSYFNLRADYSVTNGAALYIDVQNLLNKQGSINGQSVIQFPGRRINFGFNIAI